MRVVSNTSPILNLAVIDQLGLLKAQFGTIYVPVEVLDELRLDEGLPGVPSIRQAIDEGWLQVHPVVDQGLVRSLARDLDRSEAEAIALAMQLSANMLLLDERDARRIAKTLELNVTGVIGILIRATDIGEIQSLSTVLDELEQKAGFYIGRRLRRQLAKHLQSYE